MLAFPAEEIASLLDEQAAEEEKVLPRVMTFVVSRQGIVFEKDLGDDTAELAKELTAYDPDDSWVMAEGPAGE